MQNVRVAFDFKGKGDSSPPGFKFIPLHVVFDVKMDFTRKARLVAGGHVTDPPTSLTYSSVVSRESVRIAFLVAALNGLDVMMADIGNAYLNATTEERYTPLQGLNLVPMHAGRTLVIVRALYGLKSSGAAWLAHFANTLCDLDFISSYADPDVWLRPAVRTDGFKYYEYVLVYVDDILCVSSDPMLFFKTLSDEPFSYRLKDVGPPSRYLGAKIGKYQLDDVGIETWFISAESYLEKAIPIAYWKRFGSLKSLFPKSYHATRSSWVSSRTCLTPRTPLTTMELASIKVTLVYRIRSHWLGTYWSNTF